MYDGAGQMLSQTLVEYLLPSAMEVPPIEVYHIETPSFTIGGTRGRVKAAPSRPWPPSAMP